METTAENSRKNTQCVQLDGEQSVSYAEFGDPGGDPLFFFHGWPSSRLQGRLVDTAAQRLGYRVIAPDRPGIGGTTPQIERRLLDWPPLLERLADVLGIEKKFTIMGVSGGAPYVYACAATMPERIVTAGVLCGAVPLADFANLRDLMPPYRFLLWSQKHAPWLLRSALAMGRRAAYWSPRHPGLRAFYRFVPESDRCVVADPLIHDCVMGSYREAMKNGAVPVVEDGDIYSQDWGFRLEDISIPLHLWHGAEDRNIPMVMAKEIANRLPKCRARWFPEDGHYSMAANHAGELLEVMTQAARLSDSHHG